MFDNPFLFHTKKDVVSLVAEHGGEPLVAHTCSCSHQGLFASKTQRHCGACSQCIDRRVAILAAGLEQHDAYDDYKTDVFVGPRSDDADKNMGVDYARHAIELAHMGRDEMAVKFNRDLSRAVRGMPRRKEAAERLIELHERHGLTFKGVVEDQIRRHAAALVDGTIEPTSMLSLVVGQFHREPLWTRYAERIYELLQTALPLACQKHKPEDEPHLQQICDSVLRPFDERLIREFPYLKWGTGATKPDWSQDRLRLWIELKYVRKREDVRPIEKAIAEDITKYGDNGVRVLYLVYDPYNHILDRARFAEPIIERPSMMIRFVS